MDALIKRKDTVKLLILSQLLRGLNQREIAKRLGLTPQAISEYFKELYAEGLVRDYELTEKGFRWLVEKLFDLHVWTENMLKDLYSKNVIAIAVGEVREGDRVKYWFEDGLVYCKVSEDYNAIALTGGKDEDVLIKPIAFKPPERGKVTVFVVPDVVVGGSKSVDVDKLKELGKGKVVVALGVEALVACRKVGFNPVFFGAKQCCVEAVHHGCDVLAVCTQSLLNDLLQTLMNENIEYKILK
jgi:putative transcriptional regulator